MPEVVVVVGEGGMSDVAVTVESAFCSSLCSMKGFRFSTAGNVILEMSNVRNHMSHGKCQQKTSEHLTHNKTTSQPQRNIRD